MHSSTRLPVVFYDGFTLCEACAWRTARADPRAANQEGFHPDEVEAFFAAVKIGEKTAKETGTAREGRLRLEERAAALLEWEGAGGGGGVMAKLEEMGGGGGVVLMVGGQVVYVSDGGGASLAWIHARDIANVRNPPPTHAICARGWRIPD